MKKYASIALALVLTAALFTGCGCTNRNGNVTTPTILPTTETTRATTEMTTAPTTNTVPSTEATTDRGNGGLDGTTEVTNGTDGTTATDNTTATDGTAEGRARGVVPSGENTVPSTTANNVR